MSDLYKEWAIELIDDLFQDWTKPFSPQNYNEAIEKLAKKLKSDLEGCIVEEWFCSDCDYQRRYNQ